MGKDRDPYWHTGVVLSSSRVDGKSLSNHVFGRCHGQCSQGDVSDRECGPVAEVFADKFVINNQSS